MLPPFESQFVPDTNRTVLDVPFGKWGVEICKDMDFPRLSREYSRDGIGMLIVSASDFVADGWLHGWMAVLRGVEGGFSVARSANLGILTATDDRGHVLSEQDTIMAPPFVTAIANVPVRRDDTIYSRLGDWFAWLCMPLCLIAWLSPGQLWSSDLDQRRGASDLLPSHPAETHLSVHTSFQCTHRADGDRWLRTAPTVGGSQDPRMPCECISRVTTCGANATTYLRSRGSFLVCVTHLLLASLHAGPLSVNRTGRTLSASTDTGWETKTLFSHA